MQRVYLTEADRAANVAKATATTDMVKASMKEGTYIGGDYGTKANRLGPKFTDSVNGMPVVVSAVPIANRPACCTTVRLAMIFTGKTSSVGPVVPFSAETHRTKAEWVSYRSALVNIFTDYSLVA